MIQMLSSDFVKNHITHAEKYQGFHGSSGSFLGTGIFNYAIPYYLKARLCVCLGSGSGFVPRLMRQAQRDLGIDQESQTVIVDADLGGAGWGRPDYLEDDNCFFRKNFDVKIIVKRTAEAAEEFTNIDYLHIDADHSYEGVKADWEDYLPLMEKKLSFITLHDTRYHNRSAKVGVHRLVQELRESGVDVVDLNLGGGLGIIQIEQ